jgi:biopolymer transport protein ExbB
MLTPVLFILLLTAGTDALAADASQAPEPETAVSKTGEPDPLREAVLALKRDIERDTQTLNRLRAEIDAERKPFALRLDTLQRSVSERRAEADRLRRLRQKGEKEQAALIAEAKAVEEECRFVFTVFSEYARAMETRVGAADASRLSKRLSALRFDAVEEADFKGLAREIERLLALSAEWNDTRLGGHGFEGTALDEDGIEHAGRFACFGPIAYFAASGGFPAGLAVNRFGTDSPSVYDAFDPETAERIRTVVAGGEATAPVDVTSGDAIRVEEARTGFLEHVKKGGFVMIPLVAVGLVAGVLAVWKTAELGTIRVFAGGDVARAVAFARTGEVERAKACTARLKEPLRSLVSEAIEHRDSPRDHLEEIMHEHVLGSLPRLERHLGTLAVLGGVAPLLGLLGTVTGMIHTFQLVTVFGSGDARLLSGGISEALVTTEFGLAVAIPVLLVHAFLARRARVIVGALERTAVAMVNDMKVRTPKP